MRSGLASIQYQDLWFITGWCPSTHMWHSLSTQISGLVITT